MKTMYMAMLGAVVITLAGCNDQSRYSAYWAEFERLQAEETARREKAWAESERMLERDKELQERWEALLTKQEEQARRFDAILEKWESIPAAEGK